MTKNTKPINHTAIRNLYPDAVTVADGFIVLDDDGNSIKVDKTAYDAEVARLKAEHAATQYQRDRAEAYPSWQDQMDMMYHDQTEGSRTWLDAIEAVKEAHPK